MNPRRNLRGQIAFVTPMIYRNLLLSLPLIFLLLLIRSDFTWSLENARLKRQNSSRHKIIPSPRSSKDDFYDLLVKEDGGGFVDKSLFLKDFLKGKEQISRITRPRGWGKTTNLNMVRCFLEIELNSTDHRPLSRENCSTYRLFAGGEITYDVDDDDVNNMNTTRKTKRKLLKPLKVAKHADIMQFQCQFPVIFVSFEQIVGKDYRQIELKLKKLVTKLFREHWYIKSSLDEHYIHEFDAYIEEDFDKFELEHSLLFLSRLLYARFKRQIYVLVDDYDKPATSVFYHLIKESRKRHRNMSDTEVYIKTADSFELFKVMSVVEAMIGQCLKNNKVVVKQGLVTGIFDINLSLFGGVTEARSYSLLDQTYSGYFGFNDDELDLLLENNDRRTKNDAKWRLNETVSRRDYSVTKSSVKEWYGYNFLGYTIYNPLCVRSFLANGGKFDYYWTRTNGFSDAHRHVSGGSQVCCPIEEDVLSSDVMQEGLQNLTGREVVFNDYRTKIYFDFLAGDFKILLFAGYLNPTLNGFMVTDLWIPNREIDRLIKSKITAWVCDKFNVRITDIASMAACLSAFGVDDFTGKLAKVLRNGPAALSNVSPNSTIVETRIYYSGLMKTLTFFMEENYRFKNNKIFDPFKPHIISVSKSYGNNSTKNCTDDFESVIMIDYKTIVNASELKSVVNMSWQKITHKIRHEGVTQYSNHCKHLMNMVLVFCGKKFDFEYKISHR